MKTSGWRCAVCGTEVAVDRAMPWRCPRSSATDRRHVLHLVRSGAPVHAVDHPNPFVAYDAELAWAAFADAQGLDAGWRRALVEQVDAAVATVDGAGFVATPFGRADDLSSALGFSAPGGIWVKNETGNVAGSHKARHLMTILLHLLAVEKVGAAPWSSPEERAPLAISSCGNAALAAATLAAAAGWPLDVFVPSWADPAVIARLEALAARIHVCVRREGDPGGDPCLHRFHEAVEAGAVPFGVQGTENALCLDGGRTLGWEVAAALPDADRIFIQVGGGAFAASTGRALAEAGITTRLHAVQAEGCAPLVRAWDRAGRLPGGRTAAAANWAQCMWPWDMAHPNVHPGSPASAADGILDDETYDWLGVFEAMMTSGGEPVMATEAHIVDAHRLAVATTSMPVSVTGAAGLAGLLALRDQIGNDERVVVVFSGVQR